MKRQVCASRFLLGVVIACGLADLAWAADSPTVASPLSPEESLAHFQLADGLIIEVAAAEPEVVDPVAIRFDEDGRMWVAEYRDYPLGAADGGPPLSKIKILTDADGDGRYETASVFADHVPFVNGLQPWRGGVFVTRAGQIAYMKDTDGDGRADVDEIWFTGFDQNNSQLRVNHPTFALDHHLYVNNGLRGGTAVNQRLKDQAPISVSSRDLRIDPLTARAEAVSGNGQYGMTFDDFGNRFNCFNRSPMMHVVLPERYLARNKRLAVPSVIQDVMPAGDNARIYTIAEAWVTSVLHVGQFTAACGVELYRGDALPSEYYGNGFVCEPTASLVHREIITPLGATFSGKPAYEGREFLASRDSWFKPVNLEVGPDGALYVVDMYRKVIEHPQFMPEELKNRPDLRYGDDRGRVYRVTAAGAPRREVPRLSSLTSEQLVAQFESVTAWWRDTAARLIHERQDKSAMPALVIMASEGKLPAARVQALWSLDGLGALTQEAIANALNDPHPRVREQGVVLAEPFLKSSAEIRDRVIALAADDDDRLAFQVALSLGEAPIEDTIAPLADLAIHRASDPWTRRAVLSSLGDSADTVLVEILHRLAVDISLANKDVRAACAELSQVVGADADAQIVNRVMSALEELPDDTDADQLRFITFGGLARGMQTGRLPLGAMIAAAKAQDAETPLAVKSDRLLTLAKRALEASDSDPDLALGACDVLGQFPFDSAMPVLAALFGRPTEQPLRVRAVAAIALHQDAGVPAFFLEILPRETPSVRAAALDALLSRTERVRALLDAIESGEVRATELDPLRADRLAKSRDPEIAARAKKLLAAALPADRAEVLTKYTPALELKADPRHGREIFQRNCTTCHRIGDLGVDVAPSIADSRRVTPLQLLTDILQPSRAIDNNYVSFSVATVDGTAYTGLIAAETATSVTMKLPEGKTVSLLRSEIDEMRSNGISLMPDGLERNIPPQDMADLIAFIKNWRYLDTNLPVDTTTFGAAP